MTFLHGLRKDKSYNVVLAFLSTKSLLYNRDFIAFYEFSESFFM